MEGASGAGAAYPAAGAAGCWAAGRLASQVLRTDRSEFRKGAIRVAVRVLVAAGAGVGAPYGSAVGIAGVGAGIAGAGRLPYTDQRLASEQPLRTGRRPVPECRSGAYCAVAVGGMPGAGA